MSVNERKLIRIGSYAVYLPSQEEANALVASFFGVVLYLLRIEHITWQVATAALIAGASLAFWGVTPIAEIFELSESWCGLLGLVFGLTGFKLTHFISTASKDDFLNLMKRLFVK